MPSRVSIELSPSSATNSMTTLSSSTSPAPVPTRKPITLTAISTSLSSSATMDDATLCHPTSSSPISSSSASFSSSPSSSPCSSTLSLPAPALCDVNRDKGKGKANAATALGETDNKNIVDRDRALLCTRSRANQNSTDVCATLQSDLLPMNNPASQQTQYALYSHQPHIQPPQYTHLEEEEEEEEAHSSKGKGKGKAPSYQSEEEEEDSSNSGKGKSTSEYDRDTSSEKAIEAQSSVSNYPSRSDLYTHSNARSSNASSLGSLLSSIEEEDTSSSVGPSGKGRASPSTPSYGYTSGSGSGSSSGSGSGSGSNSARPRVASTSAYFSYPGGSSSGSGSCSGSKPALNRSLTGPAPHQRPLLTSPASSSAVPTVPSLSSSAFNEKNTITAQDLSLYSYDAIPEDFDFGDLPFYDTDPRTGIIYGDPHAITRPYLTPEVHFDLYRLTHDTADPRRTNIINKHGALVFYHPGRHIGQEQDSLRLHHNNQPIWSVVGRTSTWGNLTATEMATKRQIKIAMESNKKKAGIDSNEPAARFVFRWKDDDFVIEYRKQKDQYRITCSQMCGGESKWKPPQPKVMHPTFQGNFIDPTSSRYTATPIGTPSPFDASRYLQLISEYRLNSGPVLKRGDFELHNPDTIPPEFKTFLMVSSIVILGVMRPVSDKLFMKEFPEMAHKIKTPKTSGLSSFGSVVNSHASQPIIVQRSLSTSASTSASASSLSVYRSNTASTVDLTPATTSPTPAVASANTMPIADASTPANVNIAASAPLKKSRWGSLFKK
ncbi:hypothetical protein BGZ80_003302 [Entomortierella chlamydospora]|uniref:Uncharacterized protein n=1 Tax=Entomortierella chlamydospora TaxID=101097 RepID=A0A9P6SWR4_9FUNG|nr:hypothetical protein BGZ79_002599 [Entomortierella chlamydospora]KAG0008557.1 hypothetical protein BGZ80_003302 [Entomortierella chlamydospora]